MAAPLKKVTEDYHLTVKRAQILTAVPPYLLEASSEWSESARASPIGARMTKPPVEAQNGYRSRSSFSPLPWEDSYPPGLYTSIVHNGPLRTRIQDHLNEFEEFKAHIRRAQELFFGWIVTLYPLMLIVGWSALESTADRIIDPYKRHVHARISWVPCPTWIKQAIHSAVVWLLTIRKSILEGNLRFRRGPEVNGRQRSISEAKRMSPGTPVNDKLFNGTATLDTTSLGSPRFVVNDLFT